MWFSKKIVNSQKKKQTNRANVRGYVSMKWKIQVFALVTIVAYYLHKVRQQKKCLELLVNFTQLRKLGIADLPVQEEENEEKLTHFVYLHMFFYIKLVYSCMTLGI